MTGQIEAFEAESERAVGAAVRDTAVDMVDGGKS